MSWFNNQSFIFFPLTKNDCIIMVLLEHINVGRIINDSNYLHIEDVCLVAFYV